MAWSNGGGNFSARKAVRPTRPSYVPPAFRNNGMPGFNNVDSFLPANGSAQSGLASFNSYSSRQQARGGVSNGRFGARGRGGRGRRFDRPEETDEANHYPNRNGFGVRDTLDTTESFGEDADVCGGINFDAYEDIPVEVSGSDVPPPVNTFAEIELNEGLNKNIKRCKYVKPTPIQRHAIPIAVAGRDLMACAQTGSGKTAAFCFPIISGVLKDRSRFFAAAREGWIAHPTALIMSPTRELSCQIHDEATKFAYQTGVKIVAAYGGAPIAQQFRNLEKGVDILVATPGRLVDMIERGRVSLTQIKFLALDEADRMLDMGFEPQIRKIVEQMDMPPPGARQTMLFSATFPDDIQKLAADFLSNYIFLAIGRVGSSTELIVQKVELVQDMDKRDHLVDLLRSQRVNGFNGKQALTLVFVETKRGADALENWLSRKGFPAIAIHGDKIQMERERALRSFKSGATPILVATDVASRGLDIPHVAHVVNFDLPKDIDGYVHRIGRTGRAGKSGLATAFFSDKNIPLAKALTELMQEANQKVPSWLTRYAESSSCEIRGSRRGQWYDNGKYGGHDFRNMTQHEAGYHNHYVDAGFAVNSGAITTAYDIPDPNNDSYDTSNTVPPTSSNYHYSDDASAYYGSGRADGPNGYVSVVPTGWD
ncbi:DEAD-box ATP-dependent RNA helicase 11 [Neltuma alba]|uniref:DEAD-box ATP-dependent RNA helicase 11 n=1 Tax=Neltuma alba TaxID=207710 RepID=UPI0010A3D68F|nr:DEAD-box ATP-dependent RNA helicase 11-like [Prosopis alba]